MKKFMTILTAIALISSVSCEEKKADNQDETQGYVQIEADIDMEISEEKKSEGSPFIEYNPEDFTDMTVKLSMNDGEIPENVAETEIYDLSETGFSDMTPLCDGEKYEISQIIDTAFDGENLYYFVRYDTGCQGMDNGFSAGTHCFEICRYNLETGENQQIFSYNEKENGYCISQMNWSKGTLWLTGRKVAYKDSEAVVYRLDTEKNELVEELNLSDFYMISFTPNTSDKLIVAADTGSYPDTKRYIYEYNEDTKTFDEIFNSVSNEDIFCHCL